MFLQCHVLFPYVALAHQWRDHNIRQSHSLPTVQPIPWHDFFLLSRMDARMMMMRQSLIWPQTSWIRFCFLSPINNVQEACIYLRHHWLRLPIIKSEEIKDSSYSYPAVPITPTVCCDMTDDARLARTSASILWTATTMSTFFVCNRMLKKILYTFDQ